jgi:hypothetical protein
VPASEVPERCVACPQAAMQGGCIQHALQGWCLPARQLCACLLACLLACLNDHTVDMQRKWHFTLSRKMRRDNVC